MPLSQAENTFYDTLKTILALGGGALGAGTGLADAGTTSIPGAAIGAGLGNGAGESIKNFAQRMQDQPTNDMSSFKAIPEGAAGELAGQLLGAGAGKVIDAVSPARTEMSPMLKSIMDSLKTDENGNPIIAYHGSTQAIPNPEAQSMTGVGGDTFHTSPELNTAQFFAAARKSRYPDPSQATSVINRYYMRDVPELNIDNSTASDLGNRLGLNQDQQTAAMKMALGSDARVYPEMLRQLQMNSMQPGEVPVSLREAGDQAASILQSQGIRRINKPIDSWNETYNWYPQEDLFHKPGIDSQLNDLIQANKGITSNQADINAANSLMKILSQGQNNTGDNQ